MGGTEQNFKKNVYDTPDEIFIYAGKKWRKGESDECVFRLAYVDFKD